MKDEKLNVDVHSINGLELTKSYHSDSGFDIRSAEDVNIEPGITCIVKTGLYIDMTKQEQIEYKNESYFTMEAQVRPRSGLAANHGLMVVNSPGTIDNSYKGELKIILLNAGHTYIDITKGMRIAQLVFAPIFTNIKLNYLSEKDFDSSGERGSSGFGSTGVN